MAMQQSKEAGRRGGRVPKLPSLLPEIDPSANHLREYLEHLFPSDDALLHELVQETYTLTQHPRMIGDRWLCAMLEAFLLGCPTAQVLELGTFTGYTTIRLARALGEGGHVTTLESSALHADIAEKYISLAGVENRITLLRGAACELLGGLPALPTFDLIFVDADKGEYPRYFDLVLPLLREGGLLVADNVLWGNKTADPAVHDPRTEALRAFNAAVFASPVLRATLLPAGDGVLLARRCGK